MPPRPLTTNLLGSLSAAIRSLAASVRSLSVLRFLVRADKLASGDGVTTIFLACGCAYAGQPWAISLEASTKPVGKTTTPRMGLITGVLICTLPFIPS